MSNPGGTIRVDLSTVNRKRGAPVLVELMSRQGPSVGASAVAEHLRETTRPVAGGGGATGGGISNPANWGAATSRTSNRPTDWRFPALLAGAGVVVIVVAAIVGFQLGKKREKQDWANSNAAGPGPGTAEPAAAGGSQASPGTIDPRGAAGGGVISSVPNPVSPAPAPAPVVDQALRDGWNYLVVATLRRAEAEEAARYLADSGIAVQLVQTEPVGRRRVDPDGGGANNALWQLWVLQGVPSGEYSQRRAEREALETKVKLLGRTWKAQNRKAPTDFASTYWVKHKS